MTCEECYWCQPEAALGESMVCCNKDSEFYLKVFPKEEVTKRGCDLAETQQAVDYRELTPWQFASKYYM